MEKIAEPIIYNLDYTEKMDNQYEIVEPNDERVIFKFPTVYIVHHKKDSKYTVYVGETTDIKKRTFQHLKVDIKSREDWLNFSEESDVKMFVIGHEMFNKSLTLDIENKLMHYLSSTDTVSGVNNRRLNQQNEYYTSNNMETIFFKNMEKITFV